MQVFSTPAKILVTCNRGLAPSLERELTELGYRTVESLNTGVILSGSLEDCVLLNLKLRCASQVMYSLAEFNCEDPEQLYDEISHIAWESLIDRDGYFTVHGNVHHESIRSGMFANVKVKDAIVDRLRRETGVRPNTGAELLGAVVYLFWRNSRAEIFLDTSGETLAKHGYRKRPGPAPMVEALAAGTLLASRWDRISPLVNPMCGSGTLAIEAALMATNRYPGLLRSSYAFMHIKGYDPKFYRTELKALQQWVRDKVDIKIIASDINRTAIDIARQNAQAAGVVQHISFEVCDFAETTLPPVPAPEVPSLPVPSSEVTAAEVTPKVAQKTFAGTIIFNPEYGERLGEESDLVETYARIGDFLKKRCGGYWGYVFTGNLALGKRVGLKPKRRLEFATAQLDCRLLEFELYAGTRSPRLPEPQATPNSFNGEPQAKT